MSIDFEKIKELRQEINDMIAERPELQALQDEVDAALAKAGNNHQRRIQVIQEMLMNRWHTAMEPMKDLVRLSNGQPTIQQETDAILNNRVKLRCTNKDCINSSGVWTAPKFKDTYLNTLKCLLCDSKYAEMLTEVE